ncbi:coiled-coil domain-containing protein 62 isoform 1-T2 [Porphyrio hochstetteri]
MNPLPPRPPSPQKHSPGSENSMVQELQLLITELKEHDKELNDLIAVHQRQFLAWEDDRKKILTLGERCDLLNNELNKGNEIIKALNKKLELLESQQYDSERTLENTQQKLKKVSQKATDATLRCQALEEKNRSLHCSVLELSAKAGQLKAREQELLTMLKLKDEVMLETTGHITEFTYKFRKLESTLRASKAEELSLNKDKLDLKLRLRELMLETNKLKDDLCGKVKENNKQQEEILHLRQENGCLRNELALTVEKEKRKDQLLQSVKSKQAQTETELSRLRQIYLKQQHDLQVLRVSLESSQELRQKHEKAAHERSEKSVDLNSFHLDSLCLSSTQRAHRPQRCEKFSGEDFPREINNLSVTNPADRCCSATMDQHTSSPINKLQHTLAESRQMVADLELSAVLPVSPHCSPNSSSINMTAELTEALHRTQLVAGEERDAKLPFFSQ